MGIDIIDKASHPKGTLFTVKINGRMINILFLFHAIERMKKWSISDKIVIETMLQPEEVLAGHRSRYIAHRRHGNHLIRAVYEYQKELPVLITVYGPYADRSFKGGGMYEDKILKGS